MNPWWKRPEPRKKGEAEPSRSRKRKEDRGQDDDAASVRSIDVLAEAEELATREKPERRRSERKSESRKRSEPRQNSQGSKKRPDGESREDSSQPKRRVRRRRSRRKGEERSEGESRPPRSAKREDEKRESAPSKRARRPESDSKLALYVDVESLVAAEESFDAAQILDHLKRRGKVLIQRGYADWRRHAELKDQLHAASMELIDVPVHRGSRTGAEMKMVVDALEACYQRDGIDTFVLVSGRRELLPLVAKLREADRRIIGIGSRDSSPELVDGCDEFLYLEDLLGDEQSGADSEDSRKSTKKSRRRRGAPRPETPEPSESKSATDPEDGGGARRPSSGASKKAATQEAQRPSSTPREERPRPARPDSLEDSILQALETVEQEGHDRIWSSLVQQAIRRWDPDLNERRLGHDGFTELLEDAERQGLLELARDDRTGLAYVTSWRGRSD